VKNIFKIVTLEDGKSVEIKNFSKANRKELSSFLSAQTLYERIFFWKHKEVEEIIHEFERLVENGDNIIIALCKEKVVGIGYSKRFEEYFHRHIDRFNICIDKSYWGTGLPREIILELVYLSLEAGKERVVIELLPEMKEHKKEIEQLEFEQIAVLPEFFMDEKGSKKDIIIFANHLGNLWKSFEDKIDLQFSPYPMED